MKKIILLTALSVALCLGTQAQLILGAHGSYLTGTQSELNNQWGGGLQVKGKVGNRLAVGGTVRSYFKNLSETPVSGGTIRQGNNVTNLSGMLEYYFGKKVQPYIGADAGLYFTSYFIQGNSGSTGAIDIQDKNTYFGAAPKFGIQFNIGAISPFVQGQYHFLFGGGDEVTIPGIGGTPIDAQTMDKFWTLDFGLLFQIGRVGGKR